MTRVAIFCTITSLGEMKVFTEEQVSGHTFVLTARDCTQSHSITVFDHTRDYYHSLYPGQSIMLENVHTSSKELQCDAPYRGHLTKFFTNCLPIRLCEFD